MYIIHMLKGHEIPASIGRLLGRPKGIKMTSYYVCAFITAASALTSLGFSMAVLLAAEADSRINAMYAAARSLALALISLVAFLVSSRDFLMGIASVMILVQALDAVIGSKRHDILKTYGPAVTALIDLAALIWML